VTVSDDAGRTLWDFDVESTGYHMARQSFYDFRYCAGYLYMVVSEQPPTLPDPRRAHYVLPNPTTVHLLTVDVGTGKVTQDTRLNEERAAKCRIEAADPQSVLVSVGHHDLVCFQRACTR
jgi:hypothetical protein